MKIALDYDDTYTIDPEFWRWVIGAAQRAGHDVRIVTVRDKNIDRTAPLVELERVVTVIYTAGVAKRWFCSHFADGFNPDVWIDDKPESILNNSTMSPADLVVWRSGRGEVAA